MIVERAVQALVHALRLHRHVLEVGLAQHRPLALLALRDPRAAVLEPARRLPFAGDGDEELERRFRVRHDAVVGPEHAADLRRLDVDVHELAALRVDVDRARVAVGPAIADAEREVGREHRRVAVAMAGLQADHAGHQRMVVGNRAPAHQRRDHRHAGESRRTATSRSDASALMMPPPAMISGRSASFSIASAFSTCARVALGL